MNHADYDHMKKDFKFANYFLGAIFIVFLIVSFAISCKSLENICDDGIKRISGEVVYAIPSARNTRTVTIQTDTGYVKIYRVPLEQPLVNIPVCKAHGKWYWVMP